MVLHDMLEDARVVPEDAIDLLRARLHSSDDAKVELTILGCALGELIGTGVATNLPSGHCGRPVRVLVQAAFNFYDVEVVGPAPQKRANLAPDIALRRLEGLCRPKCAGHPAPRKGSQ